jgi:hypothetical protein
LAAVNLNPTKKQKSDVPLYLLVVLVLNGFLAPTSFRKTKPTH